MADGGDTVAGMGTFRSRQRRNGRILAVTECWSFDAQGQAFATRPSCIDTALIRDAIHAPT
ncbi:MAG: hypothetical protein AB7Q97_26735 [Gammaproteobacteria bacterium]